MNLSTPWRGACLRRSLLALSGLTLAATQPAAAQPLILYSNDFEAPNQPIRADCGNSLDQSGINPTYGRPGFMFVEQFSVETVVLQDPSGKYGNQRVQNGRYAIGMLGDVQDDRLALRLDVQSQRFLNVSMDVSSIDVDGCGGPFGVETPVFKVSLLDSPGGSFDWQSKKLDEKTLSGEPAQGPWSFHWERGTVALDASRATDGNVIVVFDLVSKGYAAFDNLEISASGLAAVADRDADGVEDGSDNCPSVSNGNQANADQDLAGDACDPAPRDPRSCGDRSGDGKDDCLDFCETHSCSKTGVRADAGTSGQMARSGDAGDGSADADAGSEDEPRTTPRRPRTGGASSRARGGVSSDSENDKSDSCSVPRGPRGRASGTWFALIGLLWIARALRKRARNG
ncbi:MAG TPA: hypothetical protein VJR89_15210 [Polyangiales bacterium]|nr:hypothetical protein [Polyangiales bacterium]